MPDQPKSTTTAPKPSTSKQEEEDPPKDEEGLLLHYDVIVCGTGLVQSILASALTRAGKTVLHADGNDHYGALDTVWTFDYLQELYKKRQQTDSGGGDTSSQEDTTTAAAAAEEMPLSPLGSNQSLQFHNMGTNTVFPITNIGTQVQTSYGEGIVTAKTLPTADKEGHLAVQLTKWTMANEKSPTVYLGVTLQDLDTTNHQSSLEEALEEYFQQSTQIQSIRALAAEKILKKQSRLLALDVTPSLLYASGVGVQGLLTSNVAEHLEFQTMQGMYWVSSSSGTLQRVPCSKADVMQSSLLPPLDKRRFMKFFQSAMDYATERELLLAQQQQQQEQDTEQAATTPDETEEGVLSLNERQLNQGRSLARPQNKAMSKKDLETLYDCIQQNMDFDTYLEQHAKFSPQLRQLIRHALALEITNSSPKGDENTARSLSTEQGMGRLCHHLKALGRFGTTAFLTPLYGSGELSQFFCRSAAVYGATYLLRRIPQKIILQQGKVQGVQMGPSDAGFGPPVPAKHIQATNVVVAQDAQATNANFHHKQRLLRRISVLRGGRLIPQQGDTRSVLIVPPNDPQHSHAIHGLLLDETTKVAPPGCSVLHLTTVVDVKGVETNQVLEQALKSLLDAAPNVDEIFHATFSYGLQDPPTHDNNNIRGLHVVHRTPMPMVVDEAFDQAKTIFTTICGPDLEFLALSDQMQAKLKEQLQDAYRGPNQREDDTEQVVLDSAMEMLETKA